MCYFNFLFLIFRVGTKESGTRFLTYVDAVLGFRHLLLQADLDRALSLCTGMKGKLKSRFIVLSDERVLPPAPPRAQRGKRKQDSDEPDVVNKRNRSGRRSVTPAVQQPLGQSNSSIPGPQVNGASFNPSAVVQQPIGVTNCSIPGPQVNGASFNPSFVMPAAGPTNVGYFTSPSVRPQETSALRPQFTIPPPIIEDNGSNHSSTTSADWASAE